MKMKLAKNITQKKQTFPNAHLTFQPGEIKEIPDFVALLLAGNAAIQITNKVVEEKAASRRGRRQGSLNEENRSNIINNNTVQ